MEKGVPIVFRRSGGPNATYDAFDINSGTGIEKFYAGKCVDSNILSTQTFYSDTIYSYVLGYDNTGGVSKRIDMDFDVLINKPLTISGKTVINVPIELNQGGANTNQGYVIVNVCKYTGAETVLVTNTSSTLSQAGAGTVNQVMAIDVTIPTTVFATGEYLRLTVEVWAGINNGTGNVVLGHDPMNRASYYTAAFPTSLVFNVPIRIDL